MPGGRRSGVIAGRVCAWTIKHGLIGCRRGAICGKRSLAARCAMRRMLVNKGFGIFATAHAACLLPGRITVYSYRLSATRNLPMISRTDSLEAAALERFMRASRAVNAAFDATRG